MLGLAAARRAAIVAGVALAAALLTWGLRGPAAVNDGREPLVFFAGWMAGDDIYGVAARFEQLHPQYRVTVTTSAAQDETGDAQRLLLGIAGGVPPDVVFFDRFAIGEWAAKNALEDLAPYVAKQDPSDPARIDLANYYPWAIEEASFRQPVAPGSTAARGLYGIPTIVDARMLYTNLDLLRQEGLVDAEGQPKLPANWDELRDYSRRLSRYRVPGQVGSGLARLGFAPVFGDSFLYMFAFQAGGQLLSDDGRRATMTSPPVVRALRYITDVYDDLGGVQEANAFQQSFQNGPLDPFLRGQVAMKIDGNWYLETLGDWKPDMNVAVTPAPLPQDDQTGTLGGFPDPPAMDSARAKPELRPRDDQRGTLGGFPDPPAMDSARAKPELRPRDTAKGRGPVTWASGWALVVPSTSRHKAGAFELIRFLRTKEVMDRLEQGKRERKQNEGRLYLPNADADRVYTERLFRENIFGNAAIPPRIQDAYRTVGTLLERPFIRPVTPVGQLLWRQQVRAYEAAVGHKYAAAARATGQDEVALALAAMQEPVQRQLDELQRPPPPHVVDWRPYLGTYAAVVALLLLAVVAVSRRRRRTHGYRMRETGAALFFASPWLLGFAVLTGGPIIFSIVLSFTRYDVLTEARYVGLDNFRDVFSDPLFYKSLLNTAFMILRVPILMAAGLAMALLLNSGVRAMGVYRTGLYLPVTMPIVASCLLWTWIFNARTSFLNQALRFCFDTVPARAFEWVINRFTAQPFHLDAPLWLQDPHFSKVALIVMGVWSVGGSMVIWLAGLQSIPRQLYEAANIDGCGPLRRFWHITLPMLSPYILFNSIVGLIGTMQIFTEAYIMTAGGPVDSTLFYAYYLFRQAFQYFRMGYASALAWILFLAVLALTLLQLRLSKRWVHYDQT